MTSSRRASPARSRKRRALPAERTPSVREASRRNVELFFNDSSFDFIRFTLLPQLLQREHRPGLRIWVPRCSSGQDAYSIAMLALEALDASGEQALRIIATDVDLLALEAARRGEYPTAAVQALESSRHQFFYPIDERVSKVTDRLRDAVVFAPQNILSDMPISRLDLIYANGLLKGFDAEVQRKLLRLLNFALRDGGTLILDRDESTHGLNELFVASEEYPGVFRNVRDGKRLAQWPVAPSGSRTLGSATTVPARPLWLQHLVEQRLLEELAPAAVVLDHDLNVVSTYGPVDIYLERPVGATATGIVDLARPGLGTAMLSAALRAMQDDERVAITGDLNRGSIDKQTVNVVVRPIGSKALLNRYLLMTFSDQTDHPDPARPSSIENEKKIEALTLQVQALQAALAERPAG